jgi:outer membrane biosynthesis protein TonB
MTGAAKTSSVRRVPKLVVALGATLLFLFAGLLATPGAQEAGAPAEQAPPPAGEATPSAATPAEETKPAPPAEETQPAPPAEETQPAPPAEETQPAPPVEETKPAPPAEETKPAKEAPPATKESPIQGEAEVIDPEKKGAGKTPSEGSAAPQPGGGSQSAVVAVSPAENTALAPVVAVLAAGAEPGASRSRPPSEAMVSGRGAGTAGCGVSTLSASITGDCAEGWLSVPGGPLATSSTPVIVSALLPAPAIGDAVASPRQHHTVSLENPPSTPRPGPTPGGSGGVAAAGGGSGATCSALTSVGAGLRTSEIASRQLLVDQPSWRTPFFVLIPERPG